MSDDSGSKPKLGSLKDRIAAFNQQAAAQGSPPSRPPPNPKPVQWAWKQKQVEVAGSPPPAPAPSSRSTDTTSPEVDEPANKKPGMSASDAKESIKGTLKERMAALQNQGGFGAGSPRPPIPEKPKPIKKPIVSPPIISSQPASSIPTEEQAATAAVLPAEDGSATVTSIEPAEGEAKAEDEVEEDEEEKERQRRAAIAARMARLGGTRLGMAPPVLGRPKSPSVQPSIDEASDKSTSEAPELAGSSRYPMGHLAHIIY